MEYEDIVIHSLQDELFLLEMPVKVFAEVNEPNCLVLVEGLIHNAMRRGDCGLP